MKSQNGNPRSSWIGGVLYLSVAAFLLDAILSERYNGSIPFGYVLILCVFISFAVYFGICFLLGESSSGPQDTP